MIYRYCAREHKANSDNCSLNDVVISKIQSVQCNIILKLRFLVVRKLIKPEGNLP